MVAGEHPKAIFPFIVNDVVDMPDGTFGEGVGRLPMSASVGGYVNVNFVTLRVVEIFSPENVVIWRSGKVKGAGATQQLVGQLKFGASRRLSHNGVRHGADQMP